LANHAGGRAGDPAAVTLSHRLRELKLPVGRLKTGTPPRIDGRTVDYSAMVEQPGDTPVPVFSFLGSVDQHPRQVPCWITQTNERTHDNPWRRTARRCSPGSLKEWGRAIVHPLRTRFTVLPVPSHQISPSRGLTTHELSEWYFDQPALMCSVISCVPSAA
jgi:hypothetical protein